MFNFSSINVDNSKQAAWIVGVPLLTGTALFAAKFAYNYFTADQDKKPAFKGQELAKTALRFGVAGAVVGGLGAWATGDKNVANAALKAAGATAGASLALSGKRVINF